MNRLDWITNLKILFDQLETVQVERVTHVRTTNFSNAFQKIGDILPLVTLNEFRQESSEMYYSYDDVISFLEIE